MCFIPRCLLPKWWCICIYIYIYIYCPQKMQKSCCRKPWASFSLINRGTCLFPTEFHPFSYCTQTSVCVSTSSHINPDKFYCTSTMPRQSGPDLWQPHLQRCGLSRGSTCLWSEDPDWLEDLGKHRRNCWFRGGNLAYHVKSPWDL